PRAAERTSAVRARVARQPSRVGRSQTSGRRTGGPDRGPSAAPGGWTAGGQSDQPHAVGGTTRHRQDHYRRGAGKDLRRPGYRAPSRDHRGQAGRLLWGTYRRLGPEDQRTDQPFTGPHLVYG